MSTKRSIASVFALILLLTPHVVLDANSQTDLAGDINWDDQVDLMDVVLVLQILTGIAPDSIPAGYASSGAEVDGDGKAGMAEVIYILQEIAGLRGTSTLSVEVTAISALADGVAPTISFTVTDDANDTGITGITINELQFFMSYLIPGESPSPSMWKRWAYERAGMTGDDPPVAYPNGTVADNADGSYDYTFSTPATADATIVEVGRASIYVGDVSNFQRRSITYDFDATNANAPVVDSGREIVAIAACNVCHDRLTKHSETFADTKMCVNCHNSSDPDRVATGTNMTTMIHQVHKAVDASAIYDGGHDFSSVVYPGDIRDCEKCHTGTAGDNWKNAPHRLACGACHIEVDFAAGTNHPGGVRADDTLCYACHPPVKIETYHDTTAS